MTSPAPGLPANANGSKTRSDVTRLLALLLVAVVLGPDSPGGVFYRCKFDGQLRSTCCCAHEQATDAEQETSDRVEAVSCCDVVVQASSTREAATIDPTTQFAPRADVTATLATPSWATRAPPAPIELSRWLTRPPRSGVPVFIQIRSLLI